MSIKITDPVLLAALRQSPHGLEITDAEGNFLGTFVAGGRFRPPPGFQSKFTLEELEAARKEESFPVDMKAFFRDLEARGHV